jgi:hypothetical protein
MTSEQQLTVSCSFFVYEHQDELADEGYRAMVVYMVEEGKHQDMTEDQGPNCWGWVTGCCVGGAGGGQVYQGSIYTGVQKSPRDTMALWFANHLYVTQLTITNCYSSLRPDVIKGLHSNIRFGYWMNKGWID